jgi:Protein of unknown function (DUF3800)
VNIFIDESGRFIPGDTWSVVCALALTHQSTGRARREITFLSRAWEKKDGEIKGALVTPDQLKALVDCLFRHDAILHCVACDVSKHDGNQISDHKSGQAERITRNLGDDAYPQLIEEVWALRREVERMPEQLYVQSVLMRELVCIASEELCHYFAQRKPRELGDFQWFFDAKDPIRETPQEKWWRDVLGPLIESRSKRKPFGMVKSPEFDYRFHERSYNLKLMRTDSEDAEQEVEGFDIKKMFTEATSFVDSRSDILMQAIDVLTSFTRRSLRAPSVDDETLRQIGRLQIYRKRGDTLQSINLLSLGPVNQETIIKGSEIARRVRTMTESARNLWVPQKKARRKKQL